MLYKVLSLAAIGLAASALATVPENHLRFNRDIRPILSDHCFSCHGPDNGSRKANLRLDVRDKGAKSEVFDPSLEKDGLLKRIFSSDSEEVMPPPNSNKPLTKTQKEMLRRWVQEGASYEPHWAYIRPVKSEPPYGASRREIGNPIDAFILNGLEKLYLLPSPEADRRTLLRRVSLDLTGLPPSLEELSNFLSDTNSGAYEREVDRLLASQHYGERMAVPWLDAVRFSDTVGYFGDEDQNIFPYRDYVIDSFNQNKSFDEFTIEQLAGDLLPNPTSTQIIATGFNRLGMMTREGGAQPKEYLAKYAADRVRTVSLAWMGSTMGCAECHDHKYDPFSTRDFYQMEAFFSDITQWGVYGDFSYAPNPELKGYSTHHPFPPEAVVDNTYLHRRRERDFNRLIQIAHDNLTAIPRCAKRGLKFEEWLSESTTFVAEHRNGWAHPGLTILAKNGDSHDRNATIILGRGVLFGEKRSDGMRIALNPRTRHVASIRMQLAPLPELDGRSLLNKADDTDIRVRAVVRKADGKESRFTFYHADADCKQARYVHGVEAIGIRDGWVTGKDSATKLQTSIWSLDPPLTLADDEQIVLDVRGDNLGFLLFSVSPFAFRDPLNVSCGPSFAKRLKTMECSKSKAGGPLAETFLLSTGDSDDSFSQYKGVFQDYLKCRDGRFPTMIVIPREARTTRILPRGNWQDESGEVVKAMTPHFLPQISGSGDRRLTRLDLARWLVSPENPLTARTIVNRIWKQFFGNGLCATLDDLGVQGEIPSHPELLDWLAVDFQENGWNVKRLVKMIVMSSTYRQNSNLRSELTESDPHNRFLSSQNPRRLSAEFVRDNALAIAGLLAPDIGGPSVYPYQPSGYYADLEFRTHSYYPASDERQYRRGIYSHWQRTFLHPMLASFDAPSREECTANRIVSNTPQQALTLLNDPSFVEAARVFAERLLDAPVESDDEKIRLAFETALARPPQREELESLLGFLSKQRDHWKTDPASAKKLTRIGNQQASATREVSELAAWTSFCRVLLNLHETITRY
ncbi:MAG: Protein of unknown function (DUF1553)/Protein of unknown function (DUF1549)/Planctomycete [Verrucomicrobiales bacterium]|nr:Protein of unknown function (DUF1553)/Protein of unknown function (DUF1549)/Planctomycete [Verrucomicrobiales bacterium]